MNTSSRPPECCIVRAHISREDSALDLLESEADGFGSPALPNPSRPLDALFMPSDGWSGVSFVQGECLGESSRS